MSVMERLRWWWQRRAYRREARRQQREHGAIRRWS